MLVELELLMAFLWSISPFGEAKVGLPYAIISGVNIYVAFLVCFIANVLVFPVMIYFLEKINRPLLRWRLYKKSAVFVARRAKNGAGKNLEKYGFWGLLFFVMLPVPGTGVYAGTIASYIFRISRRKAFLANTVGIFFSCLIIWSSMVFFHGQF